MKAKHFFITLEGCEGVGKSTAMTFIQAYFADKQHAVVLTREPGGTATGEAIRRILLDKTSETIFPETELLLLFAARAQHIQQVILPALHAGKTVISDRFTDASFAYQGGGRQIPMHHIQSLADWIQGDLTPDLTLLLDAPVTVGLNRIDRPAGKDRIEQEPTDFFNRIRETYLARAKQFPQRFSVINATHSLREVQLQIQSALDKLYTSQL